MRIICWQLCCYEIVLLHWNQVNQNFILQINPSGRKLWFRLQFGVCSLVQAIFLLMHLIGIQVLFSVRPPSGRFDLHLQRFNFFRNLETATAKKTFCPSCPAEGLLWGPFYLWCLVYGFLAMNRMTDCAFPRSFNHYSFWCTVANFPPHFFFLFFDFFRMIQVFLVLTLTFELLYI